MIRSDHDLYFDSDMKKNMGCEIIPWTISIQICPHVNFFGHPPVQICFNQTILKCSMGNAAKV